MIVKDIIALTAEQKWMKKYNFKKIGE
jgi:hypothetical protein